MGEQEVRRGEIARSPWLRFGPTPAVAVALVLLVVVVGFLAVGVGRASAVTYADPPEKLGAEAANVHEVTEWLNYNSPKEIPGVETDGPRVSEWYRQEWDPSVATDAPASAEMHAELDTMLESTGIFDFSALPAFSFPGVAAGAAGFYAGYKIGEQVWDFFNPPTAAPEPATEVFKVNRIRPIKAGQGIGATGPYGSWSAVAPGPGFHYFNSSYDRLEQFNSQWEKCGIALEGPGSVIWSNSVQFGSYCGAGQPEGLSTRRIGMLFSAGGDSAQGPGLFRPGASTGLEVSSPYAPKEASYEQSQPSKAVAEERVKEQLLSENYPVLNSWLNHQIDPGVEPVNPIEALTVPSCEGKTAAACVELLEEMGLTPSVAYLDWGSAVINEPDLDEPELSLEAQAEQVQSVEPAVGTGILEGEEVKITANPKIGFMPLIVPDDPAPGESAEEWVHTRVDPQVEGVTAVPEPLGEVSADPHYGPEAVVRPVPDPGTRLDPSTTTEIKVRTNPVTAQQPAPSSSAWSPPSIPAISLAPLSAVHIGCNSFPFGIFCWYGEALTSWGSEGTCPSFSVPVGHGTHVDDGGELGVDSCEFEPAMNIVRPVLVLLGTLGIALFFAYAAMGLGGSGGDD